MASTKTESRRTFLQALFGTAAGGAALAGISACGVAVGEPAGGVSYRVGEATPMQIVALRPGVRYAAAMPSQVPAVRTLASAGAIY